MVVRRRAKGRAERPPVEVRRRLDFGPHEEPLRRALLVGHVNVLDVDAPRDGEGRGRRPEQRDLEISLIELRDDVAAARLRQAGHGHIRKIEPAARARDLEGLGLAEVAEADDLRRRRRRECPEQAAPHDPMGLLSSVAARAASECSEVGLVEATSGRVVARTPCNASQSQIKWR